MIIQSKLGESVLKDRTYCVEFKTFQMDQNDLCKEMLVCK